MTPLDTTIAEWTPATLRMRRPELEAVLADAVAANASVGYLWPLDGAQFAASWQEWIEEVERGSRHVLVAAVDGAIAGCVHLAPCGKPNQPHRADVQKLLVDRRFARRGIGRSLMHAVEALARSLGRTLLTLDTRTGSAAERLYRDDGWVPFGVVPGFALDPDGRLADCTFFFKRLA